MARNPLCCVYEKNKILFVNCYTEEKNADKQKAILSIFVLPRTILQHITEERMTYVSNIQQALTNLKALKQNIQV